MKNFASSQFVITMEADPFPALIWWSGGPWGGGSGVTTQQATERHVKVEECKFLF